jgi:hypothetical protein
MEEVASAEAKMNEAKNAIFHYIKRPESIDRDLHARLVARLKKAQAEFLKVLSELDQ